MSGETQKERTDATKSTSDKNNENTRADTVIKVKRTIPRKRQDLLKWYGWGYNDSRFSLDQEHARFVGNRYALAGQPLPHLKEWAYENFRLDVNKPPKIPEPPTSFPESRLPGNVKQELEKIAPLSVEGMDRLIRAHGQTLKDISCLRTNSFPRIPDAVIWPESHGQPPTSFPESRLPGNVKQELEKIAPLSVEGMDRLIRAHGQTLKDISCLRTNSFPRIPDAVIWPESHGQVEQIVQCASRLRFVIIPFGGGTSVSGAITCPENEPRPILVLDTSEMCDILWLDKEQLLARVQAGIVGQDLEREMRARGFTVGHEPDSFEFSTLGGWVATRASGMKKNTYGNIEDLVVQTKTVTPRGVIEKSCRVPRISCGPEWEHVILGSEGCFGVVTEVTLKIRPIPAVTRYGSLVFPDWESGFHFEWEVARQRLQPSSIRLMDNEQFRFGQALKTETSWGGVILDGLKRIYITRIKGFDPTKLCVVTLLMEGTEEQVTEREKKLNSIAAQYGGVPAGAENGERGYTLTFVIAYIRDVGMEYDVVAESFETSVPWDRTLALCRNVKRCIREECQKRKIEHFLVSCRLTQTYDAGCCIYFYFAHNTEQCSDPVATYEEIEEAARNEIIASGGSISHHHGVGKLRKKWYTDTVSEPGRLLLLAAKKALDPDNIFAVGNMVLGDDNEDHEEMSIKSKL